MTELEAKVNGRPEGHHRSRLILFFLAGLTLALFWPATGFDYINLDDYPYVVENGMVSGGLGWGAVKQAFTTVHEQWWLPLLWISYMADINVFGAGPFGHHLVNILLHAANAGLLFWVLFRMTGSRWCSAFVAALFAWHPTRVEAVAWIAARKDVLSGLFFMLALLAYARHAEKPSARRMGLVFLLMLAGLMSKAILIALPPILLLLDGWPLRRARRLWGSGAWKEWKPLLVEKAALIVLAAVFMGINLFTHTTGRGAESGVSFAVRLGMIAPNVMDYLGKIAVPVRLNVIYPEDLEISWPFSIAALLLLALATWGVLRQRERRAYLLVGWLWFLVALAPVIHGVRMGFVQYTDRFTYLPLIGLGLGLAWGGAELAEQHRRWRVPVAAAAGLVLAACLVRTPAQLAWWRNSLLLFQRAIYLAPDSAVSRDGLAKALYAAGRFEEGARQARQAVQLRPDNAEYQTDLGIGMLRLGHAEEALALHEEAIRLMPSGADFHNNRGNALEALGRRVEAEESFEKALSLQPDHVEAHFNLGNLLFQAGRAGEALPHYEMTVHAQPGRALNWYNLGVTCAQLGRYAEAESCVARTLQLDPNLPGAAETLMRLRLLPF